MTPEIDDIDKKLINHIQSQFPVQPHPYRVLAEQFGMTKEEVISKWGEADIVNKLSTRDASGSQEEEWVYKAKRYTPLPLDSGYLHKNKYLYFDGNNLTLISDEPK